MMDSDKHKLRQELRAKRRALAAATVGAASDSVCRQAAAFPPFREAASVTGYIASENEIDPLGILEAAAAAQCPVYLPRMLTQPSLTRWFPGEALTTSRYGVSEPASGEDEVPENPAIAFVPVVAWDRTGTRLGRGAGFYDRLLRRLEPPPLCVGLAYEFQEVTELPREAWDVPVHYIITESEVVRCCSAGTSRSERGGLQ